MDPVQADTSFEVLDTCEIKIKENDNHRGARGGRTAGGAGWGRMGGLGVGGTRGTRKRGGPCTGGHIF